MNFWREFQSTYFLFLNFQKLSSKKCHFLYIHFIIVSAIFSTFSRKRCHSRSPPLRSPEPVAKKMCSRATPPPPTSVPATSSPTSRSSRSSRNGVSNGVNGHAVNNNGSNETAGDSRNSSQQSASRESNNSNNESRTPTRSSARLRSGRK